MPAGRAGVGPAGPAGADGLSAYEVAVADGFTGPEEDWLLSLVGPQGDPGDPGDSAYEVAVADGFVGDEAAWLASLVGADGADGADGVDGADGADGSDGADGAQGDPGITPSSANNGKWLRTVAGAFVWASIDVTDVANAVATSDSRLSDARTPSDGSVTDAKIATTLSPSKITGTAVVTADSRLSDARTPTAHKTSHAVGGGDALSAADIDAQPVDSDLTAIAALTTTSFGRALLTLADAAAMRTAAGLGTAATSSSGDFQPVDSDLTAIAALATTSFGRDLLTTADATALRTAAALGSAATTSSGDYQPIDSDLTAIAALTTTSYGRSLLALADAAAGRTALGLGTLATQSGTFSGASSGTNTGDQTTVSGNAGTATALQTARNIDGQAFDGSANITVIAPGTHAATGKTTPVDADEVPLVDSAASNVLKKLTWANLKATLKTYFDTLYPSGSGTSTGTNTGDQTTVSGNAGTATTLQTARAIDGQSFNGSADITVIAPGTHAATSKSTPVDADEIPLVDSAASNVLKKLTWTNVKATLKTYFDTLYPATSDSRLSDTRTPTDASVTAAKVAAALKPSGSAATTDEALRALGTAAGTAAAGDDVRLIVRRQRYLTAQGLLEETASPTLYTATNAPTSQSVFGYLLGLQAGDVVLGVMLRLAVAAGGTAPTLARFGIADSTGKIVKLSNDLGAAANWVQGASIFPFTSSYTVPTSGGYYACWVVNGTWGSTQPTLIRFAITAAALAPISGKAPAAFTWTGQTDLPAVNSNLTITSYPASGFYASFYF